MARDVPRCEATNAKGEQCRLPCARDPRQPFVFGKKTVYLKHCRFHTKLPIPTKSRSKAVPPKPTEDEPEVVGIVTYDGGEVNLFSRAEVLALVRQGRYQALEACGIYRDKNGLFRVQDGPVDEPLPTKPRNVLIDY